METTNDLAVAADVAVTASRVESASYPSTGWFSRQAAAFEASRYGWMAILMTAQSCLGSIACMFILYSGGSDFMLAACAALTMGSNAMFIALAPPKVCLMAFYLSVISNLAFILLNLPV